MIIEKKFTTSIADAIVHERILSFFTKSGYVPINTEGSEIKFKRGSRSGSWFSFNPSKIETYATVQLGQELNQTKVSIQLNIKNKGGFASPGDDKYWNTELFNIEAAVNGGEFAKNDLAVKSAKTGWIVLIVSVLTAVIVDVLLQTLHPSAIAASIFSSACIIIFVLILFIPRFRRKDNAIQLSISSDLSDNQANKNFPKGVGYFGTGALLLLLFSSISPVVASYLSKDAQSYFWIVFAFGAVALIYSLYKIWKSESQFKSNFLTLGVLILIIAVLPHVWTEAPSTIQVGVNTPTTLYSNYGFSFNYPRQFTITESGYANGIAQGSPSDSVGEVKVADVSGSQAFEIAWAQPSQNAWSDSESETVINTTFTTMANSKNLKNFTKGTLSTATLYGNSMVIQSYSELYGNQTIWGVFGVCFLNENDKVYSFTSVSDNDLTEQSALSYFHYYVDSLSFQ